MPRRHNNMSYQNDDNHTLHQDDDNHIDKMMTELRKKAKANLKLCGITTLLRKKTMEIGVYRRFQAKNSKKNHSALRKEKGLTEK